jgi:hypothetical protein
MLRYIPFEHFRGLAHTFDPKWFVPIDLHLPGIALPPCLLKKGEGIKMLIPTPFYGSLAVIYRLWFNPKTHRLILQQTENPLPQPVCNAALYMMR